MLVLTLFSKTQQFKSILSLTSQESLKLFLAVINVCCMVILLWLKLCIFIFISLVYLSELSWNVVKQDPWLLKRWISYNFLLLFAFSKQNVLLQYTSVFNISLWGNLLFPAVWEAFRAIVSFDFKCKITRIWRFIFSFYKSWGGVFLSWSMVNEWVK